MGSDSAYMLFINTSTYSLNASLLKQVSEEERKRESERVKAQETERE